MQKFFIKYDTKVHGVQSASVLAVSAERAIASVGGESVRIFTIMRYCTNQEVLDLLALNPAGEVLKSDDWEKRFWPVGDALHLWIQLTGHAQGARHRLTDGRYAVRWCANTGHIRFPTIGEYYA